MAKDFKGGFSTIHPFTDNDPIVPLPKMRGSDKKDQTLLPTDYEERKTIPIAMGVLDYFPAALIEVAKVSKAGNDQHNPGEELHWARGKSMDQADTLIRHFLERGTVDSDGLLHSAKLCWRSLALLQLELEAAGAPMARGAKGTVPPELLAQKK